MIWAVFFPAVLCSATAYPEGYAGCRLLIIHGSRVLVTENTSRPDAVMNSRLVCLDLDNRQILWEREALGPISRFVDTSNHRYIQIEGPYLTARSMAGGDIVWQTNLYEVTTDQTHTPAVESDAPLLGGARFWKIYNQGIKAPSHVKYFKYRALLPSPRHLLLFRTALQGHDGPPPRQKDCLKVDLSTGKVTGRWCVHLLGFSHQAAVVTDFRRLYKIDGDGIQLLPRGEGTPDEVGSPFSYPRFEEEQSSAKDWFFVYDDNSQQKQVIWLIDTASCRIRAVDITPHPHQHTRLVAVSDQLVRFSSSFRSQKNPITEGLFWMETFDHDGNGIVRVEEPVGPSLRANFLGITSDGLLLILRKDAVEGYGPPHFRRSLLFKLPEEVLGGRLSPNRLNQTVLVSKGSGDPVIAFVVGNFWTGAMNNNKDKQTVMLSFYKLRDGRPIWSLKRKLTYFKIKKKRPW